MCDVTEKQADQGAGGRLCQATEPMGPGTELMGQSPTSGKRGQRCGFVVLRDHFTPVSSVVSAHVVARRPLGREAGKKRETDVQLHLASEQLKENL